MSAKGKLRGESLGLKGNTVGATGLSPLHGNAPVSFCRLISKGEMKGQAANAVLKRDRGGFCPFVVSCLRARHVRSRTRIIKGLKMRA